MPTLTMWSIEYFNAKVQQNIEGWQVGIYSDFLRLIQMMEKHDADPRMSHTRALGQGLFEFRCKGKEGIDRAFYCTMVGREIGN